MLRHMVNLRRGLSRLALSLGLSWFTYWTCAYILRPNPSENHPLPLPLLTYLVLVPFVISTIAFGIRWVLAGFRPGPEAPVRSTPIRSVDRLGVPAANPHSVGRGTTVARK